MPDCRARLGGSTASARTMPDCRARLGGSTASARTMPDCRARLGGSTASARTTMKFEVVATEGAARAGRLTTAHGVLEAPIFLPGGALAPVEAQAPGVLRTA